MKQHLQLKISQNLALTPQLQQSIRLLQLSTLELNQELETILQENPLLELTEGDEDNPTEVAEDAAKMQKTMTLTTPLAMNRLMQMPLTHKKLHHPRMKRLKKRLLKMTTLSRMTSMKTMRNMAVPALGMREENRTTLMTTMMTSHAKKS